MTNYILENGTKEQIETYNAVKVNRNSFDFHEDVQTAIDAFINEAANACHEYHFMASKSKIVDAIINALRIVYSPDKVKDNPHDSFEIMFDVRSMRSGDVDLMSASSALDFVNHSPLVLRFKVWTFEARIERMSGRECYFQERHLH